MFHGVWLLASVCFFPFILPGFDCQPGGDPRIHGLQAFRLEGGLRTAQVWPLGSVYLCRDGGRDRGRQFTRRSSHGRRLVSLSWLSPFPGWTCALRTMQTQGTVMRLQGAATFLQLPKLAAALEGVPIRNCTCISSSSITSTTHVSICWSIGKSNMRARVEPVIDWENLAARSYEFGKRPKPKQTHRDQLASTDSEEARSGRTSTVPRCKCGPTGCAGKLTGRDTSPCHITTTCCRTSRTRLGPTVDPVCVDGGAHQYAAGA